MLVRIMRVNEIPHASSPLDGSHLYKDSPPACRLHHGVTRVLYPAARSRSRITPRRQRRLPVSRATTTQTPSPDFSTPGPLGRQPTIEPSSPAGPLDCAVGAGCSSAAPAAAVLVLLSLLKYPMKINPTSCYNVMKQPINNSVSVVLSFIFFFLSPNLPPFEKMLTWRDGLSCRGWWHNETTVGNILPQLPESNGNINASWKGECYYWRQWNIGDVMPSSGDISTAEDFWFYVAVLLAWGVLHRLYTCVRELCSKDERRFSGNG